MFKNNKKIVKSEINNISENQASKEKNGVFDRAVFSKGDGWKIKS
ncbi:hypothetical protein ACFFIF_08615 [Vagococcus entomophilus]|nr:hypothetical protein [Vagococcus entomophilus]